MVSHQKYKKYPDGYHELMNFHPKSEESLSIPKNTPKGIQSEFREAEKCYANDCFRASAGLIRSVLDKTMKANGYATNKEKIFIAK